MMRMMWMKDEIEILCQNNVTIEDSLLPSHTVDEWKRRKWMGIISFIMKTDCLKLNPRRIIGTTMKTTSTHSKHTSERRECIKRKRNSIYRGVGCLKLI